MKQSSWKRARWREMSEQALELTRKAAALLSERGFGNGRLDAELLLAAVLGIDRMKLYLQFDRPVEAAELEQFRGYIRRRLKHEPIQYILGQAHFRQLTLQADRRALIPRPETELLVAEVLRWASTRPEQMSVLDVGTGTGAIVLSLAREGSFGRLVASDVSPDALALAAANATSLGLTGAVEFRQGACWDVVALGERFDVVVSNAPYVTSAEYEALTADVREWEPRQALEAGEDGLDVIGALVAGASERLTAGGLLALEIGWQQGAAVQGLVAAAPGSWGPVRVLKDLAGRDRMVLVELAGETEG